MVIPEYRWVYLTKSNTFYLLSNFEISKKNAFQYFISSKNPATRCHEGINSYNSCRFLFTFSIAILTCMHAHHATVEPLEVSGVFH